MMKKILFMAAVTAVALSSCSKDETVGTPASEQNEINFSTYVGNTTKAVLVDDDFDSFGVYAEYNSGVEAAADVDYFTTSVARTSSSVSWYTGETYYWPTSGTLSFYAYNNDLTSGVATANLGTTTKQIALSSDGTEDLVVAVSEDNTASSSASSVALTFAHTLTKVTLGFLPDVATPSGTNNTVAVDGAANYKFNITSITLNAIADATYTYGTSSTGGTWDAAGNAENLTFTDNTVIYGGDETATSSSGEFMLIPLTAAKFTVKYTVSHKADDDTETWVEIASHEKIASITALAGQGVNTKYILSLPIDGAAISFTTTLTEWAVNPSTVSATVADAV